MANPSAMAMRVLYFLIFLSGCAGLIYQVVWHKYLAILLGAQARATAIVLAIFLGGISVGYATFGRWSRWKQWNLMKTYALVELGMAAWAFFFPWLFQLAMPVTGGLYGVLGVNSLIIDVFMSLLLIGFPTFLMGGTLPLLTQGLSRDLNDASRTHAKIYGFNTVGACLGCIFAGYFLIPTTTLAFASRFGALLNLVVAVVAWRYFARNMTAQTSTEPQSERANYWKFTKPQLAILAVGFLSGFYLLSLETVLIRLMGLSTGSSNYNFTLIVAIFVFCLGFGSLLVRDMSQASAARLYWNQVFVSLFLFVLYISGDYWSYGVHVARAMLRDIPESFYVFQTVLAIGFLGLLALPIGLAGLTLPLCFHLIRDKKESLGERVGQLYGLNTVGCVMGAIVGGYFLLNFIDLDQLFKVCVFLSLLTVVAAGYLYFPKSNPSAATTTISSGILALVLVGLFVSPTWSKERFIQPFRHPAPVQATFQGAEAFGRFLARSTEFLFWKDGPNTSVGIGGSKYQGKEVSRTIFVNGKSDGNTRGDYFTTIMLAHIPALLAPRLDRACIIGLGTGITIGTLKEYPEVKQIEVAEISNFSIENAHYFDPYDNGVSRDPKVHFNEMDAFRFLTGTREKFNIIISEPSNPWVAGIENLYSSEFYDIALKKLEDDGIFVQWIHTYSFTDELLRMVMRTMNGKFPYVTVFQLKGGDLAVVAKRTPFERADVQRAGQRMASLPMVRANLHDAGVTIPEAILALEIIPASLTRLMGDGMVEHTLESPRLSNDAAKAFYVGASSRVQQLRRQYKEFYPAIHSSLLALASGGQLPTLKTMDALRETYCDHPVSKTAFLCEEVLAMQKVLKPEMQPDPKYEEVVPGRDIASLEIYRRAPPKKFTAAELQGVYTMFEQYKRFASPIARIPVSSFLGQVDFCLKTVPSGEELHGECLLQRILILETTQPPGPEFQAAVGNYLDWFPTLQKNAPNYAKLEEARNILVKLAATRR